MYSSMTHDTQVRTSYVYYSYGSYASRRSFTDGTYSLQTDVDIGVFDAPARLQWQPGRLDPWAFVRKWCRCSHPTTVPAKVLPFTFHIHGTSGRVTGKSTERLAGHRKAV